MDKNIQQYCVSTLSEIWAQIDWDKVKGSRALGIWDEFTAKEKNKCKEKKKQLQIRRIR